MLALVPALVLLLGLAVKLGVDALVNAAGLAVKAALDAN